MKEIEEEKVKNREKLWLLLMLKSDSWHQFGQYICRFIREKKIQFLFNDMTTPKLPFLWRLGPPSLKMFGPLTPGNAPPLNKWPTIKRRWEAKLFFFHDFWRCLNERCAFQSCIFCASLNLSKPGIQITYWKFEMKHKLNSIMLKSNKR